MKQKKTKLCAHPECETESTLYKSTDKYCSPGCFYSDPKNKRKPINRQSEKRKKQDVEYSKLRIEFLSLPENKYCFVDGCRNLADTIEHTAGRVGKNYLNVSTWQPCCNFHNLEFERNTELSNKYQFSKFHEGKKIVK